MARAPPTMTPNETEMPTIVMALRPRQQDCAPTAKCGLLDLPQELRDKIYSHLPLVNKKLKTIYLGPLCCYRRPLAWSTYKRLSGVCKIIRLDVCKIFWSKNVFAMNAGPNPPKLSPFIMSFMTRVIVRSAPYYFRPFAWPRSWGCPPRFECKLLLRKDPDGWKVWFDPEKHSVLPNTQCGYRVELGRRDEEPDTLKGALEVEIRKDLENVGKPMIERAKKLLQGDDTTVNADVLAALFEIFETNDLEYMPVEHYRQRLWYLPEY